MRENGLRESTRICKCGQQPLLLQESSKREREGERRLKLSSAESRKQFSKLRDCSSSWTCRDGWTRELRATGLCQLHRFATCHSCRQLDTDGRIPVVSSTVKFPSCRLALLIRRLISKRVTGRRCQVWQVGQMHLLE